MANFCKYCGKSLENGVCDCPSAVAESQQETVQSQEVQQGVPQPQIVYQQVIKQPSPQVEAAKASALDAKDVFLAAVKNPVSTMKKVYEENNNTACLIVGAVYLLLLFLFTTINIPMIGEYMKAGGRAKIGLGLAFAAAVPIVAMAVAAMVLGKKTNPAVSFMDSLAVFCVATVPGTIMFTLSFLFGLFSALLGLVALLMCFFAWVILSIVGMNIVSKGREEVNFWVVLVVHIVCLLAILLVGRSIIESILTSALGGLGMAGSLFGF